MRWDQDPYCAPLLDAVLRESAEYMKTFDLKERLDIPLYCSVGLGKVRLNGNDTFRGPYTESD